MHRFLLPSASMWTYTSQQCKRSGQVTDASMVGTCSSQLLGKWRRLGKQRLHRLGQYRRVSAVVHKADSLASL